MEHHYHYRYSPNDETTQAVDAGSVFDPSANAPQRAQVRAELGELQMHVSKLREVAAAVVDALSPVSHPRNERRLSDEKIGDDLVPLAQELRVMRFMVDEVASTLDDALQRLEL